LKVSYTKGVLEKRKKKDGNKLTRRKKDLFLRTVPHVRSDHTAWCRGWRKRGGKVWSCVAKRRIRSVCVGFFAVIHIFPELCAMEERGGGDS
jgi:hypothetical protein